MLMYIIIGADHVATPDRPSDRLCW